MKFQLFILISFLVASSCTNSVQPDNSKELMDSVIHKYVSAIDSNNTTSGDYNFQILKNYIVKDTAYFKKLNLQIDHLIQLADNGKQSDFYYNCITLQPLKYYSGSTDAIYRFTYSPALYPYRLTVTVSQTKNGGHLQFLQYGFYLNEPGETEIIDYGSCRLMDSTEKDLTVGQFDSLLFKIQFADFWGMQTYFPKVIFDGSEWILEGRESAFNKPGYHQHKVYRISPGHTAFYDIGSYMLRLADAKHLFKN